MSTNAYAGILPELTRENKQWLTPGSQIIDAAGKVIATIVELKLSPSNTFSNEIIYYTDATGKVDFFFFDAEGRIIDGSANPSERFRDMHINHIPL